MDLEEMALQENERIFQQIFVAIPDPAFLWKRQTDGRIILAQVNKATLKLSNERITDFIGSELEKLSVDNEPVSGLDLEELISHVRHTMNTGKPVQVEISYRQSILDKRWFIADYVKISEAHVLLIIKDITAGLQRCVREKRAAEMRVRESLQTADGILQSIEESLQTAADIVQAIPSGLFIYQYEPPDRLLLLSGNPEAERLTGITIAEQIGNEFSEIWPQAHENGIIEAFLQVMETWETFKTEDLYYKSEQIDGAFRVRAFRLPGKRLGVAIENITERKRAEAALKTYTRELEESNHLKELFIDIMSHELLNLAGVVRTSAEMLLKSETDPETNQILELISKAASRILERIENTSKYSKLQTMEQIECCTLDLNALLTTILLEFEYSLKENQMHVDYLPEDEYLQSPNINK